MTMQQPPSDRTAMSTSSSWPVAIKASPAALRTANPIRKIVDGLQIKQNPEKQLIHLSIGDPTVFGSFPVHKSVINAVSKRLHEGKNNGYPPAVGLEVAREAIAERFSTCDGRSELTKEDVIITSGCSGAIEMAFKVLSSEGDNILLPSPGFSLYRTICEHLGVECRFYRLQPNNNWECDLRHMASLIDMNTRCILINNPSNPCGSSFSRSHLQCILELAEKHKLPIISDEIYAEMVFKNEEFFPIAPLSSEVPILTVGGIAKQYVVPGWRIGWILIHDRKNRFSEVRIGLARLATLILGANSLIQSALPDIFNDTPQCYYKEMNEKLERHAMFLVERLKKVEGLKPIVPQGAMYLMVEILFDEFRHIKTDVNFVQQLLDEESVIVLPGSCFGAPNFFRIVTCPPLDKLESACDRIQQFCESAHLPPTN